MWDWWIVVIQMEVMNEEKALIPSTAMLVLPQSATVHMCGIPMTCNLSLLFIVVGSMMGIKKKHVLTINCFR
jgi:Na+/H+-dicarboxylate symporter